jgi:hypothetical protein
MTPHKDMTMMANFDVVQRIGRPSRGNHDSEPRPVTHPKNGVKRRGWIV